MSAPGWMVALESVMPRYKRGIDEKVVVTSGQLGKALASMVEAGPGISVNMLMEIVMRPDVDWPVLTSTRKKGTKGQYGSVFFAAIANAKREKLISVDEDGRCWPYVRAKAA